MPKQVLNLKKKKKSLVGKKEIIVVVLAVALTTLGIKASDSLFTGNELEGSENGFCPSDMVHVPFAKGDFCIDKFEVSAGEDCSLVDPLSQAESRLNLDEPKCLPSSEAGKTPWRNISQTQARAACAKVGKRLPTNDEWAQAALGTPDISDSWTDKDCQVANNWEYQPGDTGTARKCVSSFGAFDMIGNVWEWVDLEVIDGQVDGQTLPMAGFVDGVGGSGLPFETNEEKGNPDYNEDYFWIKTKGVRGIVRGGYWNNKSDAGLYAVYAVAKPNTAETGIGFRCVK